MNKDKEFIHCPVCGSGFLHNNKNGTYSCTHCENEFVDCPVCNGNGYYQVTWKPIIESDFENCQHCHGTGFVIVKGDK